MYVFAIFQSILVCLLSWLTRVFFFTRMDIKEDTVFMVYYTLAFVYFVIKWIIFCLYLAKRAVVELPTVKEIKEDEESETFCKICRKNYATKGTLKTHQLSKHAVEKPYACRYCDKLFSLKYYLVSHERLHTGEKPFTCDICSANFIC